MPLELLENMRRDPPVPLFYGLRVCLCMQMGQAQLGVAVQFVCSFVHFTLCPCFVNCTLFFSLICTGVVAPKAVQSFCGSGPISFHW